ncbi:hypothetical protein ACUT8K_002924 [Vibrio parahaemolyticus]|uniref:Uncharacterized protein n=2 Tax=Vibrio harveyi group TaxID=717610 RepID=A0A7Y4F0S9_VIBAL|nr:MULTISPECIES: hypothetical protein [Vibrio harveyi group]AHJ02735.1 hypothetical protein VPUCM_p0058 [Vibrio parahaemolyticus UCM-V493]APX10230.1 hypothetical protein BWP24_28980 [Vibrio campbellii]EGQ8101365.1 hypothetical protein [Vibrio parahaemolyticus]EGQ8229629.1 hypothetical protein [Vibrio parahaemolyticus]EGQ8329913.1 hypothetical protein [Vibrio parahaemolyticus]
MKNNSLLLGLLYFSFMASNICMADDFVRTGRYSKSLIKPSDTQLDPLKMNVDLVFPKYVSTVGDAVQYLLLPTGYSIPSNSEWLDPAFVIVGKQPLPINQRKIKGSVKDVLKALAGDQFIVVRDDVNRLVAMDYMERWEK